MTVDSSGLSNRAAIQWRFALGRRSAEIEAFLARLVVKFRSPYSRSGELISSYISRLIIFRCRYTSLELACEQGQEDRRPLLSEILRGGRHLLFSSFQEAPGRQIDMRNDKFNVVQEAYAIR